MNPSSARKLASAVLCVATGVSVPLSSRAQEGAERRLEEILVTAQRRVESLQKAPLSLTAFSAETIDELGLVDIESLTRFTPNVTVNKLPGTAGSATVRIRGVANPEVIISSDPKVTLYLDGVLIAKTAGSMLDLIDLERIEVLRGPQGTLFGRNAVGGAIAVHSREPAQELDFTQNFDIGNLDLFESQTMVNVPLMDNGFGTLAVRAVYMYRSREGWVDDEQGNDFGEEDRQAARLSLAWSLDDWSARYTFDRTRWRDTIPAAWLGAVGEFAPGSGTPKSDGLAAIVPPRVASILESLGRSERTLDEFVQVGRGRVIPAEFVGDEDLDVTGHALTLSRDMSGLPVLGDVTVKSITAYRETDNTSTVELDGTPVPVTFFDTPEQQIDQFTQELQLVGNSFDERLDYVFGAYWFQEDGDLSSFNTTFDFTSLGDPGPINEIDAFVGVENRAWAVFAQGTLADIGTPGLNLTLGLRYTQETREIDIDRTEFRFGASTSGGCDASQPDFDPAGCLTFDFAGEEEFDNVTWMANLSYEWNDNHMSYARVATGFQSGGFNGRAISLFAAGKTFEEETAISYEVGMKSTLLDQRLQLNGSAFYTDTEDLQTASSPTDVENANVGTIINNAGESSAYGAEIELQALLTGNLNAYLSVAWIEAEFDEFIIGFDDVDGDGVPETPVDVSDRNEFIQTPEFSAAAGLRYNFGDTGFGNLWARADLTWQDDIVFQGGGGVQTVNAPQLDRGAAKDRPVNQQDAYALLDAMITLENIPLVSDGNLSLSLWGRNITDKQYRYASLDLLEQLGFAVTQFGDPRTWGLSLKYALR